LGNGKSKSDISDIIRSSRKVIILFPTLNLLVTRRHFLCIMVI